MHSIQDDQTYHAMIEYNYVIGAMALICDRCARGEAVTTAEASGWVMVPVRRSSNIHLCPNCIASFDADWAEVREATWRNRYAAKPMD
jgi:hypothetical protein